MQIKGGGKNIFWGIVIIIVIIILYWQAANGTEYKDQYQETCEECEYIAPFQWQEFVPNASSLSRVEVKIARQPGEASPITLSIEQPLGNVITSLTLPPENVSESTFCNTTWVSFDIPDINLSISTPYFINISTLGIYWWSGAWGNPYLLGISSRDAAWDYCFRTYYELYDTTPPSTRLIIGEPSCIDGNITWVTSYTPFTLIASDNEGIPSSAYGGVNLTFYSIDGGTPVIYTSPFNLSGYSPSIPHSITFWSVDRAGNIEEEKTYEGIMIDDTPPELMNESISSSYGNESTMVGYHITYVEDTGRMPSHFNPPNAVVSFPTDDEHPRHVIDYEGNVHIVWMSNRTGKWEIYYKQIDPYASLQEWQFVDPWGHRIIRVNKTAPKIIVNDTIISDLNNSDSVYPAIVQEEHEEVFLNDTIYTNKYALLAAPVRYYIDQEQKLENNYVLVNTNPWQDFVAGQIWNDSTDDIWIDVLITKDTANYTYSNPLNLSLWDVSNNFSIFTLSVPANKILPGKQWLSYYITVTRLSPNSIYRIKLSSKDPYKWHYYYSTSFNPYPPAGSSLDPFNNLAKDFAFIERYEWPEIRFKHEMSMMRDYLINNGYNDAKIYALTIPYWIWDSQGNRNIWRIPDFAGRGGYLDKNGLWHPWQTIAYNFNSEFSWIDGNATHDNLQWAFDELQNFSTDNDLVFIYLQNHGVGWNKTGGGCPNGLRPSPSGIGFVSTDPRSSNDEFEDGMDEAFCTYADPNEGWNVSNYWYDDEIDIELDEINYRHMVVVVDTCHAGGFIPDLCGPRRIICTSGREYETTYSYVYRFYERVDKTKSPNADLNKDGRISVREAHTYACNMIPVECKKTPFKIAHPEIDIWDNLHVVWMDKRGVFPEIYYSKIGSIVNYSASNNGIDLTIPDFRVSGENSSSSGRIMPPVDNGTNTKFIEHPGIAIDSGHNVSIVWSDYRDNQWQIYYQMQDNAPNGIPTTLIDDTRISNGGMSSISPSIDVDLNNVVHIAWQKKKWEWIWDYEHHRPLYAQKWEICYEKLNPYRDDCDGDAGNDGNMAIVDDTIVSSLNFADSASPDISVDRSGVPHIAFMDKRGVDPGHEGEATHTPNQWEIYTLSLFFMWTQQPGMPPPSHQQAVVRYEKRQSDMYHPWKAYGDYVNSSDGQSMYPSIETTGSYWNGDTFISWHDNRNGYWDIFYSQMANSCNNPSADIKVTSYVASHPHDDRYADIAIYGSSPDIKWQSKNVAWNIKNSYWKPALKINIDGIPHNLLPIDANDNDSGDGIIYTYGLYLLPGTHNFSFNASNCLLTANTSILNLPLINDTTPPATFIETGNPFLGKKFASQKQENYSMNDLLQPFTLHDYQSFVASHCHLNAINISLISNGNETGEIYIHLYDSNFTQIAYTSLNPGYLATPAWIQFEFNDTIFLAKNHTYYFDVYTGYNYSWMFSYSNIVDAYPNGTGYMDGNSTDIYNGWTFDWAFRIEYRKIYITNSTSIILNATDGSGVNHTYYRIWCNGIWSNWTEYTGNFTLAGGCVHYVEYYSIDIEGNIEELRNQTFYVDNLPPQSTLETGKPYWINESGVKWITYSTPIYINATDADSCSVGENTIHYRIWNGNWSSWIDESGSVILNISDKGKHFIEFYSSDALGNAESMHNVTLHVMPFLPSIDYILITHEEKNEISDCNISTNFSLIAYASGYNYTYGFIEFVNANWTLSLNASNATINATQGKSILFNSGWHDGTAILMAMWNGCNDTVSFEINSGLFSFLLYHGWNFITLPCQHNYNASTLYSSIPNCSMILAWNASLQEFIPYIPGSPYDFAIEDGHGYFIAMDEYEIFSIAYIPLNNVSVNLYTGWNALGWFREEATNAESIYQNISNCSMVLTWNTSTQNFIPYIPGSPYNPAIRQGDGFFVAVTQQSQWHG